MRKTIAALFTALFLLLGGMIARNVSAQELNASPVQFPVTGTFSPAAGEAGVPFTGTVVVDAFGEVDGELVVHGLLAPAEEGLFAPLAVTISALARPVDAAEGCAVEISTANAFLDGAGIVFLDGAQFTIGATAGPAAERELCRVVRTATRDPADQQALARALNKVIRDR